jgi:hypothetical protein
MKERVKRIVNNVLNTWNGFNMEALYDLLPNSLVLVYREKGGWKGPFLLIGITGKTCKVKLLFKVTDFWLIYVKLYYKESTVRDFNKDQSDKE